MDSSILFFQWEIYLHHGPKWFNLHIHHFLSWYVTNGEKKKEKYEENKETSPTDLSMDENIVKIILHKI